eukprot:2188443-Pleurochrysis_carterae.AAC.1
MPGIMCKPSRAARAHWHHIVLLPTRIVLKCSLSRVNFSLRALCSRWHGHRRRRACARSACALSRRSLSR